MFKDYKKETLKELGIYELRELARLLGVSSPTTKKREELENEIISSSGNQNSNNQSQNIAKKGRPPKSIKKVESILDVFVPKDNAEIALNKRFDSELSQYFNFCQSDGEGEENITITGYLRKTISENYYIRDYSDFNTVALIPNKFVTLYNLFEGDKINVYAEKSLEDKFFTTKDILLLNDKEPSSDRMLIDDCNCILSFNIIKKLDNIEEGEKILFVSENFKTSIEKLKFMYNSLQDEYKVVVFAPNISTYHKLLIEQGFKGDFIYTLSEEHPSCIYEAVTNTINYTNILLRENNKVVLVIFDLFSVKHGIEEHFALESNKISFQEDIESSRLTMKLFNLSKVTAVGSSVTVLATCMSHEQDEVFFKNSIKKNFDKILYL